MSKVKEGHPKINKFKERKKALKEAELKRIKDENREAPKEKKSKPKKKNLLTKIKDKIKGQ